MQKKHVIILVIAVVIVIGGIFLLPKSQQVLGSHELDGFAQCLSDKGMKFYGAFWCPHCQAEKKLFGASVDKLPYVECSNPDGNSQDQVCNDKNITQYPTFEFADGSRVMGETPLDTLAEKTGCALPSGSATASTSPANASSTDVGAGTVVSTSTSVTTPPAATTTVQ